MQPLRDDVTAASRPEASMPNIAEGSLSSRKSVPQPGAPVPSPKSRHMTAAQGTSDNRKSSANMADGGRLNGERRDDSVMVSADGNRPIAGSGQGSRKPERSGKKADKRSGKQGQKSGPKPPTPQKASEAPVEAPEVRMEVPEVTQETLDALPEAPEQALEQPDLPAVSTESAPVVVAPSDSPPSAPAMPAEAVPVSVHTIANAYGSYATKSLEQTRSFLEQLARVRSLDKAFELQAEFAKQAYETFVAESHRIRELHSELAKQRLKALQAFAAGKKVTPST